MLILTRRVGECPSVIAPYALGMGERRDGEQGKAQRQGMAHRETLSRGVARTLAAAIEREVSDPLSATGSTMRHPRL